MAKGQAELCNVYLGYLFRMAYKDGDPAGETNILKFKLNRQVVSEEGSTELVPISIEAPLLSLVPVPAFVMDDNEIIGLTRKNPIKSRVLPC